MSNALQFLTDHGMNPSRTDPLVYSGLFMEDMKKGLAGNNEAMPMIPTYLSNDGEIPNGTKTIVIDAGGTNFRCALLKFEDKTYTLEKISKCKMPGIGKSASWEDFISFVADHVAPLCDEADKIGFCFSYQANVTPEIDARVIVIDKEVKIEGAPGKLVGASLLEELSRRGINGKQIVILNDTVAVLLGCAAQLDKSRYSGFIGQVSGTGTNTCCILPEKLITKLDRDSDKGMIVNLESGTYNGLPRGDFDIMLDNGSLNPGSKFLEKLTAGVYLGELSRLIFETAAKEGAIKAETFEKISALGNYDSSTVDAWACGELLDCAACEEDAQFIKDVALALFERSARCMCSNLLGIMRLTGEGKDPALPVCVCAEGSLVQKSRSYRPFLEAFLKEYGEKALGIHSVLNIGNETTLPGSAAAAALN